MPDLDAAAGALEALGLAVTPVSNHEISGEPAGTANRCLMFEQGYVEILAPTLDTPHARRVRSRMQRFIGVHLACFGAPDAASEHRRLAAHGFEPEPVASLERAVGHGRIARFNVVYVPPDRMPEGRIQYVQHLTPEQVWREGTVNPLRLTAVYVVAHDPARTAARWARFSGLLPRPEGGMVCLETARGKVWIGTQSMLGEVLGSVPPAPAIAGYALSCGHPEGFAARCSSNGLRVTRTPHGHAVALPGALGGAWLIGQQ